MEPSDEFLLFEEASDANDANDAHPHPQQQHAQPQQLQPFQPFQPFVSPQQIPAGSPVGMLVSHLTNSLSSINSEANYTMRSIVAMTENISHSFAQVASSGSPQAVAALQAALMQPVPRMRRPAALPFHPRRRETGAIYRLPAPPVTAYPPVYAPVMPPVPPVRSPPRPTRPPPSVYVAQAAPVTGSPLRPQPSPVPQMEELLAQGQVDAQWPDPAEIEEIENFRQLPPPPPAPSAPAPAAPPAPAPPTSTLSGAEINHALLGALRARHHATGRWTLGAGLPLLAPLVPFATEPVAAGPFAPLGVSGALNVVAHAASGTFHAALVASGAFKCKLDRLGAPATREEHGTVGLRAIIDGFLDCDAPNASAVRESVSSAAGATLARSDSLAHVRFRGAVPLNVIAACAAMRVATFEICGVLAASCGGTQGPDCGATVSSLASATYGYTAALMDECYRHFASAPSSEVDRLDAALRELTDPDENICSSGRASTTALNIENKCAAIGPHPHILMPPVGSCVSSIKTTDKMVLPAPQRILLSDIYRPDLTLPRARLLRGLHLACETAIEPLALVQPAADLAELGGVYPLLLALVLFYLRSYAKKGPVNFGHRNLASLNIELLGTFTVAFTPHAIDGHLVVFVHALSWVEWVPSALTGYPFWSAVVSSGAGPVLHHSHFPSPMAAVWAADQVAALDEWMGKDGNTVTALFNLLRLGDASVRPFYPSIDAQPDDKWPRACALPLFDASSKGTRATFVVYEVPVGVSSVPGIASQPRALDTSLPELGAISGAPELGSPARKRARVV